MYVTLTENGKKFYLLENSVFADDYSTAFSPDERKLILTKIMPARDLEMKLVKEALKIVKEFENEKLGDTQKITDRLDADFYFVIQQYTEKQNTALENQIKKDILEKTKEIKEWNATKKPEEDAKQSPIQAYRVATMGRLSEIGLIRWIIEANDEGHAVSKYKILDKEMATSIMKTK